MKLTLRWVAALIALAVIAWIWFARDATTNSSAAAPDEVANELDQPNTDELAPVAGIENASNSSAERVEASIEDNERTSSTATTDELAIVRVRVLSQEADAPLGDHPVSVRTDQRSESAAILPAKGARGRVGESMRTDAQGHADFEVEPRRAHVVFSMDELTNFESASVPPLEPGVLHQLELHVTRKPDVLFLGKVVDGETRAPIGGASIRIVTESWKGDAQRQTTTSSLGLFEVRARSWIERHAHVDAEGYGPVIVALTRGHATLDDACEIRLSRAAQLEVRVLESDRPVTSAAVTLSTSRYSIRLPGDGESFPEDPRWFERTGSDGIARFDGLPARAPFELKVATTGRAKLERSALTLQPGETRRIDIVIGSGARIVGRVETSEGVALVGVKVLRVVAESSGPTLFDSSAEPVEEVVTDSTGRFEMRVVPEGSWWVGVSPSFVWATGTQGDGARVLAPIAAHVDVTGSHSTIELVLRTDADLYIRGRVLNSDGQPVAAGVRVQNAELSLGSYGRSGSAGSFRIGPLPHGKFEVFAGGMGDAGGRSDPQIVAAGAEDVELRLKPSNAITIRVAPHKGTQVEANVLVRCESADRGAVWGPTQNGVRTFEGFEPGTYSVFASTDSGLYAFRGGISVRAGAEATEVAMQLQLGASLTLRYEGALDIERYEIIANGARLEMKGCERGINVHSTVPTGAIEVRRVPRDGGEAEVHKLTLAPGEERELVLGK